MAQSASPPLPIDEILPQIRNDLAHGTRRMVVEAPPGAGKTTRLPPCLLSMVDGKILVSEPRRIAARLSAARVAQERNGQLGNEVGYRVRFEERSSASTRLCYLTEGLLLKTILDNPTLEGVAAVILDEVHERSSDLDLLLALCLQALERKPDLVLVVMSATLDAGSFSTYLAPATRYRSEGRSYEVAIRHAPKDDDRPLPIQIRSALRSWVRLPGDVLVFLPGEPEIRACQKVLEDRGEYEVTPLHGNLSLEQQTQALVPGSGARRKVILSTNVTESSLTAPGVTTVIDSGLSRLGVFDAWAGIARLETVPVSQARAVQRAGRAGRVAPGEAIRLYTKGNFESRPRQDVPEILRSDLSSLLLRALLHQERAGLSFSELRFLTPVAKEKWDQARALLRDLGAMDESGLSTTGRIMAQLPLPPRLGRVVVRAHELGIPKQGCLAAALLSERDIVVRSRGSYDEDVVSGASDLSDRLDRFERMRQGGFSHHLARDLEVEPRRCQQVDRASCSMVTLCEKLLGNTPLPKNNGNPENLLLQSLLSGFFDRVAALKGDERSLLLCDGQQATLSSTSCVKGAPLVLALSADAPFGRRRKPVVRLACRLDPDWLFDQLPQRVQAEDRFFYNDEKGRVDCVSELRYGKLVLDESRGPAPASEETARCLAAAALSKGPVVFDPEARIETLAVQLALLREHASERLEALESDERAYAESWSENLLGLYEQALSQASQTRTTLAELRDSDLAEELTSSFSVELSALLREGTPRKVRLLGGRELPVFYERGKPPFIRSRLQDFFSMNETPTICFGRVPLQIHFLAPNQRPIQVTTDLAGFWLRHYPDLRKQLMRRYPKHDFPEDGSTAKPPAPRSNRPANRARRK